MSLEAIHQLWPEICMLIGACCCLFLGMSSRLILRRATSFCALATLLITAGLVQAQGQGFSASEYLPGDETMPQFIKWYVLMVALVIWTLASGLPGKLTQTRLNDAATPLTFDPARSIRGEFFAFFLFSLTGVMLCASAHDLAWLFLALELTSLPTYVMVATTRDNTHAQESGVKYFFLGAMSAAIFLYGFTLIYGATGTMNLHQIAAAAAALPESQLPMFYLGIILSVLGISFKIAAFPMHFYTADVYQGAATPVTAFLAFVPKTAGFVSLILILSLVGWPLPPAIHAMLWIMAALTMTIGNVLGMLQNNVKRALAYSSVAHSGYMLIGLAAGPTLMATVTGNTTGGDVMGDALGNGLAGILFYLVAYGFANFAAFAVLGCLERQGDEAQTYDDISGLYKRDPKLAVIMLVSMISLLGLPPLVGFLGKIYIFEAAMNSSGPAMVLLVVIAVINTAISAVYYLRIVAACFFGDPLAPVQVTAGPLRITGALLAAIAAVGYGLGGQQLVTSASNASDSIRVQVAPLPASVNQPAQPVEIQAGESVTTPQADASTLDAVKAVAVVER